MKIKVLDEKHIIVNNGDRKRSSVIIVNEAGTVTRARKTERHQTAMSFTKLERKYLICLDIAQRIAGSN